MMLMVYKFSLPPLVLHTFYREDVTILSNWVANLIYPSDQTAFFNILDTRDGIDLMGAKGILLPEEIDDVIQTARSHGAFISYRAVGGEGQEPYEINSSWYGTPRFYLRTRGSTCELNNQEAMSYISGRDFS